VKSILVATDADRVFDEVDNALADEDTAVFRVRNGRDVEPACHRVNPDLVVLDLQIGNAGGVAVSLQLRQEQEMGRLPRVGILMLLDRQADVFLAQMAQADGWLVKPLDAVRLTKAARAIEQGGTYQEGMLDEHGVPVGGDAVF
jgi:DNA-binding response OmpR family regulator